MTVSCNVNIYLIPPLSFSCPPVISPSSMSVNKDRQLSKISRGRIGWWTTISNNNPGCLYGDKEDKIKLKGQLTNSRFDRLLTMHNAVGGKWVIL